MTPVSVLEMLTTAYGATAFIALAGYVPQFRAFLTNKQTCREAPILTWALWGFQSAIVVCYAGLVNGDTMFILGGCFGAAGNLGGLVLVLWGRYSREREAVESIAYRAPETADSYPLTA